MGSCGCGWCESNRKISVLRQTDPGYAPPGNSKKYPKRTKKIWDDRIKAQEKVVARDREWLAKAIETSKKHRGWMNPAMYQKWVDEALKKLEKIKAEAEKALRGHHPSTVKRQSPEGL